MRSRTVLLVLAAAVLTFVSFGFGVTYGRDTATLPSPLAAIQKVFSTVDDRGSVRTFEEVWTSIHRQYVEKDINDAALVQGAIRGLVGGLGDPYSTYFNPTEAKEFADEINGTFDGVGMEVGFKDSVLAVIAPLPATPAERAGLQAGDLILQIDEQDTNGLSIDEAIKKIRGPKGSTVNFLIQRGDEEPKKISVVRETIVIRTVTAKILPAENRKIGYLQISSFTDETVINARKEIQNFLTQDVDGFIVDLRNNPGGLLDASVDITSMFVDQQVVVREIDQTGEQKSIQATGGRLVDNQPVVLLVNGGSASASEIVAGALQDLGRATIIGEKTFGKGSVQQLVELPDGSTLKLTVAKWYTPKNRSISESGITPDIVIAPDESGEADVQLDRAISEILAKLR